MKTVLKGENGREIPVVKASDVTRGNPGLADKMKQSGSEVVGSHTVGQQPTIAPQQQLVDSITEVSYAERNMEYTEVSHDMPSRLAFYPYNGFALRPLKLQEAKKLHVAHSRNSLRIMCDAISSCLQPDRSALQLTRPDFDFCLYWLRMNSYKKSPYEVGFSCTNMEHIERVVNKKIDKPSLYNKVTIHNTSELDIVFPDLQKIDDQINIVKAEYGIDLYPVLMADVVDVTELKSLDAAGNPLLDADGDPLPASDDVLWTAKYASVLSPFTHGRTLQERMAFFDSLDCGPELLGELDFFIQISKYGVQERVNVACKECGAKMDIKLSINALTFFPAIQRA